MAAALLRVLLGAALALAAPALAATALPDAPRVSAARLEKALGGAPTGAKVLETARPCVV